MAAPMLARLIDLAVVRYGADRLRLAQVLNEPVPAAGLALLVREGLLTAEQVAELRQELEATCSDSRDRPEPPLSSDTPRYLGVYRILRRLGQGGMGAVYLGYDEGTDRQVAIKVLAEELACNRAAVDRFYREARIGALLEHPCIVRGITAGQDQSTGKHYMVQEFVDGPSARTLLDRFGRLSVGDAVHIALDMARALEYLAARNFVHRDIKPDNILLTRAGQAKLADLGLAKRIGETSHLTALHQGFGSPYYMPYEQVMHARRVDGRSDIFALGASLYHLLTGHVPFPGDQPQEIIEKKSVGSFVPAGVLNREVPAELDRILARMMAREPRDRYQTASELFVELEGSNLAAPVPGFVAFDPALADPLAQTRSISANEPTQPNPEIPSAAEASSSARALAELDRLLAGVGIGAALLAATALCRYFLPC